MEYASNAKGNLAVTLGAIGTGLGAMSGTGLLSNVFGNGGHAANYITKDEATMMQALSAKDSEIALLKADQASEIKMTEVYKQSHQELVTLRDNTASELKEIRKEITDNRREQDAWNASQSVANAQMSSAISVNANSIAALQNCCNQITQLKIPNSAVCPGWGNITVEPATTT